MYAIRNKKTKKYLYGTDYRYPHNHQMTSFDRCITFATFEDAVLQLRQRWCSDKLYEIVEVKLEVVNTFKCVKI